MLFCWFRWLFLLLIFFVFKKQSPKSEFIENRTKPGDCFFACPVYTLKHFLRTWHQQKMWLSWRCLRRIKANKERYIYYTHNPMVPTWCPRVVCCGMLGRLLRLAKKRNDIFCIPNSNKFKNTFTVIVAFFLNVQQHSSKPEHISSSLYVRSNVPVQHRQHSLRNSS